jgi:iduronate 2-sulfatase
MVFNAGASLLTYGDSDQYSVAPNTVDVWINGQLIDDDAARNDDSGDLTVFGFKTFNGVVGMEFQIDDFEVNTTLTKPVLTYEPSGVAENYTNDGSIAGPIRITLSNDAFSPDVVSGGHVSAGNIPAGLTPVFTRESDTAITLSFIGSAAVHDDADSISNLTVSFADGAFTDGDAGEVTDSYKSDLGMTFVTTPPPNILFIAIDDLRPDLNCYEETASEQMGGPSARLPIHSPVMDLLASEGTVFERAYCQVPLCGPTRVSIMTGTYPDRTKIYGMSDAYGGNWRTFVPDGADIISLPQQFRNHGYYAASYGKVYDPRLGVDVGFSWDEESTVYGSYINSINSQNRAALENYDVSDNQYTDGKTADTALNFLATHNMSTPFFLAVGFAKPHLPFNAPRKYWDLYDPATIPLGAPTNLPTGLSAYTLSRPYKELETYTQPVSYAPIVQETMSEPLTRQLVHGYLACISYVDAQIGKIINDLKARGLYDNTIIVVWGDHGFKLADFGEWAKATTLEVDSRVPLIIRLPASMTADRDAHSYSLVEFVDVLPTVCAAAGLPIPDTAQGRSLMPILKNANASVRQTALTQYRRTPGMAYSVRSAQWRYTEFRELSGTLVERQLFDLSSIPHVETVNVVDSESYFPDALSALIFDYSPTTGGAGANPVQATVQGTSVSGGGFLVDFSGSGTYSIWKSRSLSPPLFTGPVRSGVSSGANVELDAGMAESAAFYKILPDGVTP